MKIDKQGWDKYTGLLGMVPFKDGVSERELTDREADIIGATIRLVDVKSEKQVGAAVKMFRSDKGNGKGKPKIDDPIVEPDPPVFDEPDPIPDPTPTPTPIPDEGPTQESLEKIADEGGIKAIREVGNKYGVKGVEISKMIEDILEATKNEKAEG